MDTFSHGYAYVNIIINISCLGELMKQTYEGFKKNSRVSFSPAIPKTTRLYIRGMKLRNIEENDSFTMLHATHKLTRNNNDQSYVSDIKVYITM